MKICPIVLAGGSGTRLWPLSRKSFPKQFLNTLFDESLFAETLTRVSILPFECIPPIIICNEEHKFLALNDIRNSKLDSYKFILEPEGKNTAPAITMAALYLEEKFDEEVLMLVLPSDHRIDDNKELFKSIDDLKPFAESGSLCACGVDPTFPNTEYGYLEHSKIYSKEDVIELKNFHEKPISSKATEYLSSGNFAWNSGIYFLSNKVFLSAIKQTAPSILSSCKQAFDGKNDEDDSIYFQKHQFTEIPSDSIDFALMERSGNFNLPMHMSYLNTFWSDLGSWSSILKTLKKDDFGNASIGKVIPLDTENSLLISNDEIILSAIGLKDMIVINSSDALLIASVDSEAKVKEITEILKEKEKKELIEHKKVYRPWGDFTVIEDRENYKVKNIRVNPHSSLSLQRHKHRSEHWVVVSGKATVIKGEEEIELVENESIYISANTIHSLINRYDEDLYIIEVQTGDYLGEDDIERLEDKYGRV